MFVSEMVVTTIFSISGCHLQVRWALRYSVYTAFKGDLT